MGNFGPFPSGISTARFLIPNGIHFHRVRKRYSINVGPQDYSEGQKDPEYLPNTCQQTTG